MKRLKPQEKTIIHLLAKHPEGLTAERIEQILHLKCTSVSARNTELKKAGILTYKKVSNGVPLHDEKRKTTSGKSARVLILSPEFLNFYRPEDLDTAYRTFRNRPIEQTGKEDEREILESFHRFIDKWLHLHTETYVWNVLRKVDPIYREKITPLAAKRMFNRLKKQTV